MTIAESNNGIDGFRFWDEPCVIPATKDSDTNIYYASSDTRLHVATSSIPRLLDYVKHTPADGLCSATSVQQRIDLVRANRIAARKS